MIDFIKSGISWLDVDFVRNEVQHIVASPDPTAYPDRSKIRYYLDVEIPEYPQASSFRKLLRLEGREKPVKISNGAQIFEGCTFRLESLLTGQLILAAPEKGQSEMTIITSLTSPYQIREIIEPAIESRLLPSRIAMRAGLSVRDFVGYEQRFFSRFQPINMQFLTWQSKIKLVGPMQEEYLYFLLNLSPLPTKINLRIRLTYANGNRSEVTTKKSLQGVSAFQVVCAPVGPAIIGITSDVVKYEVWLSDENNFRFTEVRTFEIDRRKHHFERTILFANSFGGFDTLRLLGKSTEESDVVRQTTVKEREVSQGLDYSELAIVSISETSGIQVSTGLFERDQANYLSYLRELMLSECILEATPYGYEALNLITNNFSYKDDATGLVERTFQFRRTYSDTNFSALTPVASSPARATAWRGVGNLYLLDAHGKRTGLVKAAALRKYYIDNESDVIPLTQKANVEGDKDYLVPSPDPDIVPGSTPFPNIEILRKGSFTRQNCAPGEDGMEAMIIVPANSFGGEKLSDSDSLAEAEWNRLNTQEYANEHGSCAVAQNYAWNVPVNHFHYRTNMPSKVGIYQYGQDKGNIQALQNRTSPYIFPIGTNDLDFPCADSYYYHIYGLAGQNFKVEVFKNGVFMKTEVKSFPITGTGNSYLFDNSQMTGLYVPVSKDKFFIKLTIL